ncbi:hypothetical protein D018_4344A, partial [Vibrio parahaemolyticus VP2007-007]
MTLPAKRCSAC